MKVAIFTNVIDVGAFSASFRGVAWGLYENGVTNIDVFYYNGGEPRNFPPSTRFIKLEACRALTATLLLNKYLKKEKTDFLITGPTYLNLVVIFVSLFSIWSIRGGKVIISHHHPLKLGHEHTKKNNKYIARLLYRFAAGSYGASPGVIAEAINVAKLSPSSVKLIPNIFTSDRDSAEFLQSKAILENTLEFTFLTVSRLAVEKNIPFLLECFSEIVKTKRVKLVIAGEGAERGRIEQRIDELGLVDSVTLLGFVPSAQGLMSSCDIFLLTSEEEGFGQVLVEAMSMGKPVICTNAKGGGVSYVTDNGKYAKLIPLGDKSAFVEAMLQMMDKEELENYSKFATQRALDFSPNVVGKDLVQFMESLGG